MKQFNSEEEFAAWLTGRPSSTAAIVSIRAALRVLPFAVSQSNPAIVGNSIYASRLMRAVSLSWLGLTSLASPNVPDSSDETKLAINRAANTVAGAISGRAGDARASIAHAAFAASNTNSLNVIEYSKGAARAAISACGDANTVWQNITLDCKFTDDASGLLARNTVVGVILLKQPLWLDQKPDWFAAEWQIAHETFQQVGQGFELWHDWFQRRIDGEATGFDLPPDADTEIDRRLVAASNDWWERPPAEVNADIKAWLTELTPPPAEPAEADFTQNPRALTFGVDADGRIGLAPDLAANRLLDDTDAQDRHAEVRREAQALQGASQHGQTQATDLDQPTRDFIEALGESLVKTKPSWLVARGEKLRRMRAQRQNGTSLAPPLSERQAEAVDALITALDIMVGLDPYLLSIRQASYDPDIPRGIGDPVAIRLVIDHALAIKAARADAHDALADAVANVPADAAPDDRRRLTLWADFKNFIQATGRFIWKHKDKVTLAGVAGAITLIQLNAATLKGIFVASPTMLEIIRWIELIKLPS